MMKDWQTLVVVITLGMLGFALLGLAFEVLR